MSISQAIIGAKAELSKTNSNLQRLQLCLTYTRIIATELLQTVKIIPYGIRAKLLHNSLPPAHPSQSQSSSSSQPTILKNHHYATTTPLPPRCTMDIYLPPGTIYSPPSSSSQAQESHSQNNNEDQPQPQSQGSHHTTSYSSSSTTIPVALFVHGGVWTSGEAWHYAPMATRLAQHGIVTAIMQYSLYPDALMPEMVAQVNEALNYTMHHLAPHLDTPTNNSNNSNNSSSRRRKKRPCVTLLGHSAGAQLCAMALLERLATKKESPSTDDPQHLPHQSSSSSSSSSSSLSMMMPDRFIGMAGVYDLAHHYEYERGRGVHELSTMKRAAGGGGALFDTQSPAVILRQLLSSSSSSAASSASSSLSSKRSLPLIEKKQLHVSSVRSHFPKTTLMCSSDDTVVPAVQSFLLASVMKDCGLEDVEVLHYDAHDSSGGNGNGSGGHGGFVVDWQVDKSGREGGSNNNSNNNVTRYGRDLIQLISTPPPSPPV